MKRAIPGFLRFMAAICLVGSVAHAGLPLPDHLVYGTIALSGQFVNSANSNIVVEARRPLDGQLLASYRMGSVARLGDFLYELRIKVEAATPSSPDVAQLGETLNVTVSDTDGVLDQAGHQINAAGVAIRLDFGSSGDANQNGIPDDWEIAHFGSTVQQINDSDGDGNSDLEEYIAGTDPRDSGDLFRVEVKTVVGQLQVSFHTRSATGPGYQGRQRFYALETSADLNEGLWAAVNNLSRIPGNDQDVTYHPSQSSSGPIFFRARVWLEGP